MGQNLPIEPDLREHVSAITAALEEHGALDRSELWDIVDGGTWEATEFGRALSQAAVAGLVERGDRNKFVAAAPELEQNRRLGGVHFIPSELR
jgi:hypothetical protein